MANKAEGDLELDAEAMQDLGSAEVVRKSIPLKLKKPKLKVKSSKSSKSKKEKKSSSTSEHKESSEDGKTHKPPKKKSTSSAEPFAKHNKEELDWNQQIVIMGEKVQDPMIHVCSSCSLPVLVYGRVSPCKHVFCLTCAEKFKGQCSRCGERVERIEPAGIGQIFVCSFGGSRHGVSGCRRSYLSQRDLLAHIRHRHQKDGIPHSDADAIAKRLDERVQQTVRMPFLGQQFIPTNIRPAYRPTQMPVDNRMIPAAMPQRDQVFMDGQRMQMMGQFQQTAPPQQFQPMVQQGFRPAQAMLQRAAVQNHLAAVDQFLAPASVGQYATAAVSRPAPMNMAPNPMQYPTSSGQFIQPGMQQATMQQAAGIQQTAGMQQAAGMPQAPGMQQTAGMQQPTGMQQAATMQQQVGMQQPGGMQQQAGLQQGRVDASMPPARIETMQQTGMQGVQMGHANVDGTWQGVGSQDWTAGQRGAEMQGAYGAADASRFPRTF